MQACGWLALLASVVLSTALRGAPVLPLEDTREITIGTPSGWMLTVEQNGSGRLQFGQEAIDGGEFSADTFSFKKLYRKLADEGSSIGNSGSDIWIGFRGGSWNSVQYWQDRKVAYIWMSRAYSNAKFFDEERMNALSKNHPFVDLRQPK